MKTNTQQPRQAVIDAFHHQIAVEWQNNPPNGWCYFPVQKARDIQQRTLDEMPQLAPLDIRGQWHPDSPRPVAAALVVVSFMVLVGVGIGAGAAWWIGH